MMTGLLQMRLQRTLASPKRGYVNPDATTHPDLDLGRPIIPTAVFALGIVLALVFPHSWASRMVFILIFPLMVLYGRRYRRLMHEYEQRNTQQRPEPTAPAVSVA